MGSRIERKIQVRITNEYGLILIFILIAIAMEGYNIRSQLERIANAIENLGPAAVENNERKK